MLVLSSQCRHIQPSLDLRQTFGKQAFAAPCAVKWAGSNSVLKQSGKKSLEAERRSAMSDNEAVD
jgi:hypothetical protein